MTTIRSESKLAAAKAIAAYQRQLRCGDSRFDAWLDGDDAVDDHGPCQPAGSDVRVVGADGGAQRLADDIEGAAEVGVTLLEGGRKLESSRQGKQLRVRIPDSVSASLPVRQAYVLKVAGAR